MEPRYAIANPDEVLSPGLVVFEELLRENLSHMIAIAGDIGRLRPHCKTHKMIDRAGPRGLDRDRDLISGIF